MAALIETAGRIKELNRIIFPDCFECKLNIWQHPGGRCIYSPHAFVPGTDGVALYYTNGTSYAVRKNYASDRTWQTRYRLDGKADEYLVWINYLMEIGWRP